MRTSCSVAHIASLSTSYMLWLQLSMAFLAPLPQKWDRHFILRDRDLFEAEAQDFPCFVHDDEGVCVGFSHNRRDPGEVLLPNGGGDNAVVPACVRSAGGEIC